MSQFLFHRAGERAFFVAEQFALQQRFGDRGAVDADVMFISAAAQAVQCARDQFLAGAAFAEDEHARVGRGHGADELAQFAHLGGLTDDLFERDDFAGLGTERGIFA
jgi:hypothetical protein